MYLSYIGWAASDAFARLTAVAAPQAAARLFPLPILARMTVGFCRQFCPVFDLSQYAAAPWLKPVDGGSQGPEGQFGKGDEFELGRDLPDHSHRTGTRTSRRDRRTTVTESIAAYGPHGASTARWRNAAQICNLGGCACGSGPCRPSLARPSGASWRRPIGWAAGPPCGRAPRGQSWQFPYEYTRCTCTRPRRVPRSQSYHQRYARRSCGDPLHRGRRCESRGWRRHDVVVILLRLQSPVRAIRAVHGSAPALLATSETDRSRGCGTVAHIPGR